MLFSIERVECVHGLHWLAPRLRVDCAESPPVRLVAAAVRINKWAAVLLSFITLGAPFGAMAAGPKRVLLLQSFGPEIAPFQEIVDVLRTELVQSPRGPIAVYDASLVEGQTAELSEQPPFLELLRYRFGRSPPDVVVTIGGPAAAFYLQNRDKVFPKTPAVIGALDERLVPAAALRTGDSVVAAQLSDVELVENILRVLPDTQRIAVILGDSPLERAWIPKFREEFAQFANRVDFEWLNNLSLDQIRKRIAKLPPHSAVLFAMLATDAAGVPHPQVAGLTDLVAVSAAPIFSFFETEFGQGVVGGPYFSEHRHGARIAAAVFRTLLDSTSAPPRIDITGFETPVYDWRAFTRWGIDPARVPAGSEIRFQPPSLWNEHRALIISAIAIFILQALLVIGLLWQRVRRRSAELEAQALSGRLIDAHEDERRWLARELHDDITQRLAALAIVAAKVPGGNSLLPDPLIREGLSQLSEDVHNLSYRLHPSVLDDLGLVEALKAECDRVARVESVRIEVKADSLPQSVSKEVALGIYRIAQEALRNIGRHANASSVQFSLVLVDRGLQLEVTDNGVGFEPPQPSSPRQSLGHAGMRERVRLMRGRLDIRSSPGSGTTVVAWVPIPKVAS